MRAPVQFLQVRVEHRVAARKRDLAADVHPPAKIVKIVQDCPRLFQGQGNAAAAVIAVLAMQVTGLGYMPLQGEDIGCQKRLYFRLLCVLRVYGPANTGIRR